MIRDLLELVGVIWAAIIVVALLVGTPLMLFLLGAIWVARLLGL